MTQGRSLEEFLAHSLFDRFTDMVERAPAKLAIASESKATTYAELYAAAAPIATRIMEETEPGQPVGLLIPQGPQFLAGMLGCLAAGNPYVPLDRNYPIQRLKVMSDISKAPLLFTTRGLESMARQVAPPETRLVFIEDLPARSVCRPRATAESHAYLLFTSGSTGTPKGVLDSHRSIMHNTMRQSSAFGITPEDRQTLLYTCGVYGGARDIYSALLNGASLYHYDVEVTGYTKIGDWIRENGITLYCSVATIFRYLTQYISRPSDVASVRVIKLGGEASRKSDIETFQRLFADHCVFYTGLASTETGTVCQYPIRKTTPIESELLPLGFPAIDTTVQLVGEDGNEVAKGQTGEIVVVSDYIASGYFGQPKLSSEKFSTRNGQRCYRTGDLGRWDESGRLWHCGRADQQVKIRGNRIELTEVESALLANRSVRDVVVQVRAKPDGENALAAYVVPQDVASFDEVALRTDLLKTLPTFMVPSVMTVMEKFPRTVNGKVDRSALPDPFVRVEGAAPANAMDVWQLMVAGAWRKVLGREHLSIDDNFFAIGGHSLGLIQVLDEVERRTSIRIHALDFMKTPTIRAMAAIARQSKPANGEPVTVYREGDGRGCLLLVPGFFGLSLTFRLLCQELNLPMTIIAPQLSEFAPSAFTSMEGLCEYIVDLAAPYAAKQPLHVFGYSFGGTATIQLVEIMQRRGLNLGIIGVFDSDPPLCEPGSFELVDPIIIPAPGDDGAGTILARSKATMASLRRIRNAWTPNFRYDGRAHLVQSTVEAPERQRLQLEQWKTVYPSIQVSQVDGSHRDMFNFPHVTRVARILEGLL